MALPVLDATGVLVREPTSQYSTTQAQFQVTLSSVPTAPVTFSYYTQSNLASDALGDFSGGSGSFTIPAGQQTATVNVTVNGDAVVEGNETFNLVLLAPVNATLAGGAAALVATGTIIDAGASQVAGIGARATQIFGPASASTTLPTLTVHDAADVEGSYSYTPAYFLVTLDKVPTAPVTVNYYFTDGTASGADGDYRTGDGSVTLAAGQQSTYILMNSGIFGDTKIEGDETVKLVLTGITNAVFAGNGAALVAKGTIIDDDTGSVDAIGGIGGEAQIIPGPVSASTTMPTVSVASVSQQEGSFTYATYNNVKFLVTLDKIPTAAGSIDYIFQDGTASEALGDYTGGYGTLKIVPGQQSYYITGSIQSDTKIEGNETFSLVLTGAKNVVFANNAPALVATATIVDDDNGKPVLSDSNITSEGLVVGPTDNPNGPITVRAVTTSIAEGDSTATTQAAVFVLLSRPSASDIVIHYATADGSATATGSDYYSSSGNFTIPAGSLSSWVSFSVLGDTKIEGDEFFTANLTIQNGAVFEGGTATAAVPITIRDNDGGGGTAYTVASGPAFATVNAITGTAGSDAIIGTAGSDLIYGSRGDDTIDAGAGTDTVVFAATKASSSIALVGNGVIVSGPDGVDVVSNAEILRFSDGSLPTGNLALIDNYYQNYIGRYATAAELGFWTNAFAGGTASATSLRAALLGTAEASAHVPAEVNSFYRTFLGRDPSAGEANYWVNALRSGSVSFAQAQAIFASQAGAPANEAAAVAAVYQTFLGRAPSAGETSYWTGQLAAGAITGEELRAAVLADPGGQAFAASQIGALYTTYLGRAPTTGEIGIWQGLIASGSDYTTLRSALLADSGGQAHTAATVTTLYDTYFGRDPSAGEISVWKGLIAGGADFGTLRAALVGDPVGVAHTAATITTLYETYFGRDPSANEIGVWKGLIAGGADFGTLRAALVGDPAGQAHTAATVTTLYETYLGRDPSAGEIGVWKGLVASGTDFTGVRAALLADPAGQAHTTATVTTLYDNYFGRDPSASEIGVWKGLIAGGDTFDQLADTLLRASGSARVVHQTGTAAHDVFTVSATTQNLTIDGFDAVNDTVAVSKTLYGGLNLLDAAHAREIVALDGSTDVLVTLDASHAILFEHTRLSALHASDFSFYM